MVFAGLINKSVYKTGSGIAGGVASGVSSVLPNYSINPVYSTNPVYYGSPPTPITQGPSPVTPIEQPQPQPQPQPEPKQQPDATPQAPAEQQQLTSTGEQSSQPVGTIISGVPDVVVYGGAALLLILLAKK